MTRETAAGAKPDIHQLGDLHAKAAQACKLLKALANNRRLLILCQLADGAKTVSELQAILGLSQSALSQHLAILRRENIVRTRKQAQSVSYSLSGHEATEIMKTLYELYCPADSAPGSR